MVNRAPTLSKTVDAHHAPAEKLQRSRKFIVLGTKPVLSHCQREITTTRDKKINVFDKKRKLKNGQTLPSFCSSPPKIINVTQTDSKKLAKRWGLNCSIHMSWIVHKVSRLG